MLIKTDTQVKAGPKGLHRIDRVTGLYLKKGVESGSGIDRYRQATSGRKWALGG